MTTASGIHHITALASDPKRNYEFYTRVLGLRFIKRTVNFDDKSVYHLYYGDRIGSPGTALTFFPHPDLAPGRPGVGQAVAVAFAVPRDAMDFWQTRLQRLGVAWTSETRFGDTVVQFHDPDGLQLELIGVDTASAETVWPQAEISADAAIRGFHSTTLWLADGAKTAAVLTGRLGFTAAGVEGERQRFTTGRDGSGRIVDLRVMPGGARGAPGAGTIHHVAFRVGDDAAEVAVRAAVLADGHRVTPVIDRKYFRSAYFREPGHVLFELATDGPGFTVDEPVETLGQAMMLPPHFEGERAAIIAALPVLE